jgi:transcriptional regulator with XRE-family HTH domain
MNTNSRGLFERAEARDSFWIQRAKTYVGLDLERLFEQSGMTKSQWADKIGKSKAYVSKLFRHDVNFTIETIVKLARSLNGRVEIRIVPGLAERSQDVPAQLIASMSSAPFFAPSHVLDHNADRRKNIAVVGSFGKADEITKCAANDCEDSYVALVA